MNIGITKVRNEEHIIQDTLDCWSEVCDQIIVYDDDSQDETAEICRSHPAVIEVISSNCLDPDRLRAEWYNRQLVLNSAKRHDFEWIAYFDGDEHLYDFDKSMLKDESVKVIATQWYDIYITPEDANLLDDDYQLRRWVSPEYRQIPFFYRNSPVLAFTQPDQRIMHHESTECYPINGLIRHWGKGFSVDIWDRKVQYYGHEHGLNGTDGMYAEKWRAREGNAIHHDFMSDEGNELILWQDVREKYADSCERTVLQATS